MNNRTLLRHFARWREQQAEMILVTVVDTAGSTYSKAGRHLLIGPDNRYAGLVGGGCLEGDLLLQAEAVRAADAPTLITYDMRDAADDLWGMGLGCRGMMRLLLQPLKPMENWEPLTSLAQAMQKPRATAAALTIASSAAQQPVGELQLGATAPPAAAELREQLGPDGSCTVLHWTIQPWPRLLVLGAGPDTGPVLRFARDLGWTVSVADHRPALLEAAALAAADHRQLVEPERLADELDLAAFDAVLIMSHHLQTDAHYLQALAQYEHRYAGLLGPHARRAEVLARLQLDGTAFAARLRGPVGLNIGADSPESIALAIIAEIHAVLAAASGASLTPGA